MDEIEYTVVPFTAAFGHAKQLICSIHAGILGCNITLWQFKSLIVFRLGN